MFDLSPLYHTRIRDRRTLPREVYLLDKSENINTREDLTARYEFWDSQDTVFYIPLDEIHKIWYVGYYSHRRGLSPNFEISEVWGGNPK